MLGDEGIELSPIERARLYVGQRLPLEGIAAVPFEIANAIAGCTQGRDLPPAIIERMRNRDDAFADLEERADRIAGTKEGLMPLPVPDPAERKQMLKTGIVQWSAKVERPPDARVTGQPVRNLERLRRCEPERPTGNCTVTHHAIIAAQS